MIFSSILFMFIYLPVTLAVYYFVPLKARNAVLFAVSLIFYGWGEPVYVFLMLASITLNYFSGLLVEKYRSEPKKVRLILGLNVALNLAGLFFFKYYDFFAANLSKIPGLTVPKLGLELPIGISFYTFQAMSYPIDVWRRDGNVQKNYVTFGAFVTLFPQLIAGPIIRYKDVDDQLKSRRHSWGKFSSGASRFTVGLCKKVLLANGIGRLWDSVAATDLGELSVMSAILGVLAFSFQIYFDFSGYSDMAIGLGRMLGFEFLENFNYPYIAKSITDFWRRWHISLSVWFRDYVYIPLGGNRCSPFKHYRNIFIVWALTGFWHGASWNYLLWGIYFAVLLMIEKAFLLKPLQKAPSWVGRVYTLFLVAISWCIFAIEDTSRLLGYLGLMFGLRGAPFADMAFLHDLRTYGALLVVLCLASTPLLKNLYNRIPPRIRVWTTPGLIVVGLIVCTAYLVDSTYNPFLYFRF